MLIPTVTFERARAFGILVRLLTMGAAVAAGLVVIGASKTALGAQEADGLRAQLLGRLTDLQRDSGVPGATAGIVLADGRSFEIAVGMSDAKRAIAMKPGDLMMSGSTGKTFVAATILQLAAERRLDLDDPIRKWLGRNNWFGRLPNASSITVRMLLNHTSGVPDHVVNHAFIDDVFASPNRVWRPDELVRYILDQPAQSRAGAEHHYADTNYILLGMVIESATSSNYYAELKRRMLDPLGLRHTVPSDRPNFRTRPGLLRRRQTLLVGVRWRVAWPGATARVCRRCRRDAGEWRIRRQPAIRMDRRRPGDHERRSRTLGKGRLRRARLSRCTSPGGGEGAIHFDRWAQLLRSWRVGQFDACGSSLRTWRILSGLPGGDGLLSQEEGRSRGAHQLDRGRHEEL
jgi:CubicO group peptidase (beta-lactamase class C family)